MSFVMLIETGRCARGGGEVEGRLQAGCAKPIGKISFLFLNRGAEYRPVANGTRKTPRPMLSLSPKPWACALPDHNPVPAPYLAGCGKSNFGQSL